MNQTSPSKRTRTTFGATLASMVLLAGISACGGGSSATPSGGTIGAEQTNPDGTVWFTEKNFGGAASSIFIRDVFWGRLVDVYDNTGALRNRDFLIGEDIQSDGVDYQLEINPVTEQASLTILRPFGSGLYTLAFDRLDQNLGPILPKSDTGSAPPYSFIPRNATIGVRFSDLIDPATLNQTTVKLRVGNPPVLPFEARLIVDPNYGGSQGGKFYPTRVLLDTTVSELEGGESLLPLNSLGLPASKVTSIPNVSLRIPTVKDFSSGQFQVLENLAGNGLSTSGNGPVDFNDPSLEVIRAMRSGGDALTTGDTNNGFLLDLNSPRIVGSQPASLLSVVPDANGTEKDFIVSLEYVSLACSKPLVEGDVIRLPGVFAEVTAPSGPPSLGQVGDIRVRLLSGEAFDFHSGPAEVLAPFNGAGGSISDCFVSFSPLAASLPSSSVSPDAQMVIRFSEPMDPSTLTPFDTFTVTRTSLNPGITGYVVGDVNASADLKEFRFVPSLPMAHTNGVSESYFMNLVAGDLGVTDLAGNALAETIEQISFDLNPTAATERNGSLVLRFENPNEDGDEANGVPLTEYSGQFLLDINRGLIRSRPVERRSAAADKTQAVPSIMIALTTGVQTPLSPLGSRMMGLYRYFDVGFSITDSSTYNMDVEGLNWSPLAGQVQADIFEEFEINLAHSNRMPDEHRLPSLLPQFTQSGLAGGLFTANILTDENASQISAHPKELGYLIDPAELFAGDSGTKFMPWPMNRNKAIADYSYFTWRDTANQSVGGPSNTGVPAIIEQDAGILASGLPGDIAPTGHIPTIGLPLLMEFKCFPSDTGVGLNSLDCAIAINSSPKPTFRIFSTGGYDTAGNPQVKNPDTQPSPTGGFNANPALSIAIGANTSKTDNVFYYGQLDLVVRVSRTHTRWLNTEEGAPDYLSPVIEPRADDQPAGTELIMAYRGSTQISAQADAEIDPLLNADSLDAYGDEFPTTGLSLYGFTSQRNSHITGFLQQDSVTKIAPWQSSVDDVDGGQFIQVRFTMIGNTETGLTPELSAFGLAFLRNS
ncbi:MAG: hypothetical protein ACJAVJ_001948 [Planctomycetota bacterium]|jgi:hypothetical protein